MKTILFIMIALYLLSLISLIILVRRYCELEFDEDPVPDAPGDYDYIDYSERPYVNYN